ncbi:unnamed protein product, partial [Linum tenue]
VLEEGEEEDGKVAPRQHQGCHQQGVGVEVEVTMMNLSWKEEVVEVAEVQVVLAFEKSQEYWVQNAAPDLYLNLNAFCQTEEVEEAVAELYVIS